MNEGGKPQQIEKVDRAISLIMGWIVSLALPVWGLVTLVLGAVWNSPWWIATGIVVGAVGVVMAVGNPFVKRWLSGP